MEMENLPIFLDIIYLFALVDYVDSAGLVVCPDGPEVCVEGGPDDGVVQAVPVDVADRHCVTKVRANLHQGWTFEVSN